MEWSSTIFSWGQSRSFAARTRTSGAAASRPVVQPQSATRMTAVVRFMREAYNATARAAGSAVACAPRDAIVDDSRMIGRLILGLVKGLVLGALVGFGLAAAGMAVPGALIAY